MWGGWWRRWFASRGCEAVALVGYSMGGNLVLGWAGELGARIPPVVKAVVGISPLMDLAVSSAALHRPQNRIYEWHFLKSMLARVRRRMAMYPQDLRGCGGGADSDDAGLRPGDRGAVWRVSRRGRLLLFGGELAVCAAVAGADADCAFGGRSVHSHAAGDAGRADRESLGDADRDASTGGTARFWRRRRTATGGGRSGRCWDFCWRRLRRGSGRGEAARVEADWAVEVGGDAARIEAEWAGFVDLRNGMRGRWSRLRRRGSIRRCGRRCWS